MIVDNVRPEKASDDQNETTGLLKPSDAGGNIPRSPSSEAVAKVRVNACA